MSIENFKLNLLLKFKNLTYTPNHAIISERGDTMKKIFFAPVVLCAFTLVSCGMIYESSEPAKNAGTVEYTTDDLNNLRDFILSEETTNLNDKDYDLNNDDRWDSFDVCLMRDKVSADIQENPDILVTYFSCTNTTKTIAEYMADYLSADIYEIVPAEAYTAEDISYNNSSCRANREQNDKTARPKIANPIDSIEEYEIIYIGYPVWWGEEPRIIDTFLESYDFSDKIVIPFCTSGSSGISTSEKNIANLVSIGNQLSGKRFPANATNETVNEWLNEKQAEIEEIQNIKSNGEYIMNITVGDTVLTAKMCDNSSAKALKEMLEEGALTIDMHDYANFEKVGTLTKALPRNDEQITTEAGDLILYQGNSLTIYYDTNTWKFTRLGKIENVTKEDLLKILGDGDVTVTLSLAENK